MALVMEDDKWGEGVLIEGKHIEEGDRNMCMESKNMTKQNYGHVFSV